MLQSVSLDSMLSSTRMVDIFAISMASINLLDSLDIHPVKGLTSSIGYHSHAIESTVVPHPPYVFEFPGTSSRYRLKMQSETFSKESQR